MNKIVLTPKILRLPVAIIDCVKGRKTNGIFITEYGDFFVDTESLRMKKVRFTHAMYWQELHFHAPITFVLLYKTLHGSKPDTHARAARLAVRLAEKWLAANTGRLEKKLKSLTNTSNPRQSHV